MASELTYKEIADKMFLSPKTVENHREKMCEKLQIKTRVGLVMYAIKNGIVKV
jgi:DNA-binding CsgD family transcriptional regulator